MDLVFWQLRKSEISFILNMQHSLLFYQIYYGNNNLEQNSICKILYVHACIMHVCQVCWFLQEMRVKIRLLKNCSQLHFFFLLLRRKPHSSILIYAAFKDKTVSESCSFGKYPCTSQRKPWHFPHFPPFLLKSCHIPWEKIICGRS